jgi:hypothetical protein
MQLAAAYDMVTASHGVLLALAVAASGCGTLLGTHQHSERVLSTRPVELVSHPIPSKNRFLVESLRNEQGTLVVEVARVDACVADQGVETKTESTDDYRVNQPALITEAVLASAAVAATLWAGASAAKDCKGTLSDTCDVEQALTIDFGILTGLFGIPVLVDLVNNGGPTKTVRTDTRATNQQKPKACGHEAAPDVAVSLAFEGGPPHNEQTDGAGLARFRLPSGYTSTADSPTTVTLGIAGETAVTVTLPPETR